LWHLFMWRFFFRAYHLSPRVSKCLGPSGCYFFAVGHKLCSSLMFWHDPQRLRVKQLLWHLFILRYLLPRVSSISARVKVLRDQVDVFSAPVNVKTGADSESFFRLLFFYSYKYLQNRWFPQNCSFFIQSWLYFEQKYEGFVQSWVQSSS